MGYAGLELLIVAEVLYTVMPMTAVPVRPQVVVVVRATRGSSKPLLLLSNSRMAALFGREEVPVTVLSLILVCANTVAVPKRQLIVKRGNKYFILLRILALTESI